VSNLPTHASATNHPATEQLAVPQRVLIAEARPKHRTAFYDLMALIGGAVTNPGEIADSVRQLRPGPPFTHGPAMLLTAHLPGHAEPVGALVGGVPNWIYTHPLNTSGNLAAVLSPLVFTIHTVAVRPEARGQGIGRKLIRAAERRAAQAGYTLATLEHEPDLAAFYTRLGYRTGQRKMIIALSPQDLCGMKYDDLWAAAKPLAAHVRIVDIPGAPAPIVSGMVPGSTLPATTRIQDGQLVIGH